MTMYAQEKDTPSPEAVRRVLARMLSKKLVDAVLVPARTAYSVIPMPTLIADPQRMEAADPLAPVAPFNAARQAAAVARHPTRKRVALVLRPCEIRAFVELVKLRQCTLENCVLIGIECLGRLEKEAYARQASTDPDFTQAFYTNDDLRGQIITTCKTCDHFQPESADLTVSVLGPAGRVGFAAGSEAGEKLLTELDLVISEEPKERAAAAKGLLEKRIEAQDQLFRETAETINSIEKFESIIADCLNCYNCRVACPVCYCKECVFVTDVFAHPPEILLRRASKRGAVKMPTDTSMFHMTRLAHMSHACVGCGHCSSVCPSGIPVADIFRTVAAQTQALFGYEPGRDAGETIPYLAFEKKE
jgi:formate dehydrogenase subunit beta